MIAFWLAALVVTLAGIGISLWPLWRRHQPPAAARGESSLRLYRAQLATIEREQDQGLIAPAEGEGLRTEIKRRILAAAADHSTGPATAGPASAGPASAGPENAGPENAGPSRRLAALLAIAAAVAAVALYAVLGRPGAPDQPLAARNPPSAHTAQLPAQQRLAAEEAVTMLQARLAEQPDDATAWRLLGRSLRLLGRPDDAVAAYRRAVAVAGDDDAPAAELGEALVAAAAGRVDDEAMAAFAAALAHDPDEPRAHYYLALRKAQDGDVAAALRGWRELIARAPADAPWLPQVRQQAERAAAALTLAPDTPAPPAPR